MNQRISISKPTKTKINMQAVDGQQEDCPLSVQAQIKRYSLKQIVKKYKQKSSIQTQFSKIRYRITQNCKIGNLVILILIFFCCIWFYYFTMACHMTVSNSKHSNLISITSERIGIEHFNGEQLNKQKNVDQKVQVEIINNNSQQHRNQNIFENKENQINNIEFQKNEQQSNPLVKIAYQKFLLQKKEKQKKEEQSNILNKIPKNPYWKEEYSYLQRKDVMRAKRWRFYSTTAFIPQTKMQNQQYGYYQKKYQISQYEQLPFCIVVPTYNNNVKKRAIRNLKSIAQQNYSNYRVLIIDDASTDSTGKAIVEYVDKDPQIFSQFKIQINQQRQYTLKNTLDAARNFCKPQQIFMVVDGDDEMIGLLVLKLFNAIFQRKKVWFMYTNFITSNGLLGYSRPYHPEIIQNNSYRQYSFAVTHQRAFYTKLLLNINEDDFKDEKGKYFTAAGDMSIIIPCLEQAHTKVIYVPEITYFYNVDTGFNVHKQRLEEQRLNNLKIRAKAKYEPLQRLF